ncbi:Glucosamine-6-phosphate deaminase [Hyella patelloides LEGE 07179]|uniref:Glucosamine-6-phosphate deaminase n=1 Tax=Hyella patelloides LEGE 07179 TaxID=945734 RepID=A0A563W5A9_9CYAN|nr:glucosamine-6-phosphate deaminase [Hyella patelloides]VEP18854.1 Glucosamine-6-phosphate deaminase [Hyella patelloides LEGE 07179]
MPDRTLSSLPDCEYLQIDRLTVKIYNSSTELTKGAVRLAQSYLETLLTTQETVSIVLATGNSQLHFLDLLVTIPTIDWSRIILYHLDEYLGIAAEHPGSFRYYLKEKVGSKITPRRFYFIEGDALQPLAECRRYSKLLQQQPIDLCLLGIGDNGHIAFNEPGVADFKDPDVIKLVKLETKTRQQQVNGGYFSNLNAVPQYAYTLTIPTICNAKKIFCLAPGKHKVDVVKKTLNEAISTNFPATILRTQPQAILFCDRNAPRQQRDRFFSGV